MTIDDKLKDMYLDYVNPNLGGIGHLLKDKQKGGAQTGKTAKKKK